MAKEDAERIFVPLETFPAAKAAFNRLNLSRD
jgi:hypothetical protein